MIKLFSEKVRPTFTSSKHNIIIVESHEEVFFDVFEFEINGTKYIAEKCAEYNGSPVVSIPVEEDNEVKDIPFILTQGESFNVFFNTNNKTWSSKSPVITENISIGNEVVSIDSNKQALDREINNTQKLAGEYTERLKLEKVLEEATALVENNNHNIEEFLTNSKIDLLEEFNSFTLKSKFELEKYTDTKHKEIEQNITKSSNMLFKEFVADNKDKLKLISESLSDKIDYLVEATISSKFTSVSGDIANKHKDIASSVRDEINLKNKECIEYVDNFKEVLTEQNVILNDTIKKGVDKALSRIGNTKLDINNRIDVIEQDVALVSNKIEKYYDDKLGYLEKFFSEDVITNIEKLIDDSKLNLLDQVKQDGNYLKESVLEEKHDPKIGAKEFDNSIKKLRSELEKSVSTKFTNEVNSLKRLIEYSSGGGTVAYQYINGGTMYGDLIVEGKVTADCGDSDEWCSTHTTVSANSATWGAGGPGGIYDDSLLQANSGNWDSTYTTVSSNSANWVKYDIADIATPATWVLDVDNLTDPEVLGDTDGSATKVPTQQSVKAYIDDTVTGINNLKGAYNASTDQPAISAGVGVLQGDSYYVGTDGGGLFYTAQVDPGDLIIATESGANTEGKWIVVNRNINDELMDNWNSTYTTVDTESANWDSTYNTVTTLSNTWDDQFDSTAIEAASSNWNNTYTTVTNESADWESTYTTVDTYSADWESGGSGDFCGKVVTMDQLSSCGTGTISVSANLDVNDNTIDNVHSIQFHLDDTLTPVEGNLNWNETEGTLDLGLKGSTGNELGVMLGMEQVLKVKSTEDIIKGQVVYISSAQGSHPLVSIASNTSQVASHAVAGIAAHDINANQFGYITTQGILGGINTSGISAGDNIYLGANGNLTSAVPTTPALEVRLGYCIIGSVAPGGKMYVSIELGFDMEDLHDVNITSIQDKDILSYNSSTSAYENVTSNNWQSTFTTMSTNSANWVKYDIADIATPATWVLDVDNLTDPEVLGDTFGSATKVPTQQSVKAYVDGIVTGINNLKGDYNASTDQPAISAGVGVLQGDAYYVGTDGGGLFYNIQVDPGDLIIASVDNADAQGEWIIVNRNIDDELIDRWNSAYTTVSSNSADWDSTYTTVTNESADWDSTYTTVTNESANWDSTYTTVSSNSADWESTYTTVDVESANWDSTYTTVTNESANWDSTYTTVDTESANWDSTYTTVSSNSATWDDQFDSTAIEAASGNWDSTYTTVTNESANWDSTYTTVSSNSANWVKYDIEDITPADWVTESFTTSLPSKVPTQASVKTYVDGLVSGTSSVTVSDIPPTVPTLGDLWFSSILGKLFVYYIDVDLSESQWVDVGGGNSEAASISIPNQLTRFTTIERDNLTGLQGGEMIYNTTDNKAQVYENSAWANLV